MDRAVGERGDKMTIDEMFNLIKELLDTYEKLIDLRVKLLDVRDDLSEACNKMDGAIDEFIVKAKQAQYEQAVVRATEAMDNAAEKILAEQSNEQDE